MVSNSIGQFVNGMLYTHGIESFRGMLKRGYNGVFHHFSEKHLLRYADEFEGRRNLRPLTTIDKITTMNRGNEGNRLPYQTLVGPKHTRQPALIKNWE